MSFRDRSSGSARLPASAHFVWILQFLGDARPTAKTGAAVGRCIGRSAGGVRAGVRTIPSTTDFDSLPGWAGRGRCEPRRVSRQNTMPGNGGSSHDLSTCADGLDTPYSGIAICRNSVRQNVIERREHPRKLASSAWISQSEGFNFMPPDAMTMWSWQRDGLVAKVSPFLKTARMHGPDGGPCHSALLEARDR